MTPIQRCDNTHQRGFTLVELALVVGIVALLLGGLMVPISRSLEQKAIATTQARLEAAQQALVGFALLNGRLPCPDTVNTGLAGATIPPTVPPTPLPLTLTGCLAWRDTDSASTPVTPSGRTPGASWGHLPWAELGVDGVDGWGNRLDYAVYTPLVDPLTFNSSTVPASNLVVSRPLSREQLAYVPERFSPPGWLHARDYFRLAARLHGLPFPQPGLIDMLAELDLDEMILDRPLRECSKGMAQKIGLAAAFLARRRLLVLDEPMSGLDPLSRIRVREQLRLQRSTGCAVLMSTHSLADVEDLADRVAILHAGSLRFIGTVDEWLAQHGSGGMEEAYLAVVEAARLAPDGTPPGGQPLPTG